MLGGIRAYAKPARALEHDVDAELRSMSSPMASVTKTLSPASVRNVMADLEALGLVYAPHTSAGRLPTKDELRASPFWADVLDRGVDSRAAGRQHLQAARQCTSPQMTYISRWPSSLSR